MLWQWKVKALGAEFRRGPGFGAHEGMGGLGFRVYGLL